MRTISFASVLTALLLLHAPVAVAGRPANVPENVTVEKDIAYRKGNPLWKLNLIMPKAAGEKLRPGLVVVHGGGWSGGNKGRFQPCAIQYAQLGFVCINVNYRLSGTAPFPAAVEDVKCAVRWFRANAAKYRVDPERIGGIGNSAGAHLVSMLALVPKEANLEGDGPHQEQSSLIDAGVVVSGPAVITMALERPRSHPAYRKFVAGPEKTIMDRARAASPITYVSEKAPPLLIIHGTRDGTVPVAQADAFVSKLKEKKANVTYLRIERGTHNLFTRPETTKAATEFLQRVLGSPGERAK
ncbi:MAG: alpha/beta hydrolase fold domain-containing protein [Planctomycetota bacterium]